MRRHLPLILTFVAVTLAVGILVWQLVLTFGPEPEKPFRRVAGQPNDRTGKAMKPERDPNPIPMRSFGQPEPVRVEFAGVLKYSAPLHANAPGRMPAKEGTRTLGGETLPPDPAAYAAAASGLDPELVAWVTQWEAGIRRGAGLDQLNPPYLPDYQASPADLYELGRAIRFVQGNANGGIAFFEAAVKRAAQTLAPNPTVAASLAAVGAVSVSLGHAPVAAATLSATAAAAEVAPAPLTPAQHRDLHALRMMARPIWQGGSWAVNEEIFTLLGGLEPEGSFARFRARFLLAEATYMRVIRGGERQYEALAVERYRRLLLDGDTGGYQPSPLEHDELVWLYAGSLYAAGLYADALPYLEEAATHDKATFRNTARLHHVLALIKLGRTDEARAALDRAHIAPAYHQQALQAFDEAAAHVPPNPPPR